MTTEASSSETPHLRRELRLWEAVGISLVLMAPSMAANINPQGTADTGVGRAVPLAFALATIGVLLIAWTFVRLTQRFNHAGSVYGFVGATLGPGAGVISGWALMGTYTFYGVVTSTAAGIFGAEFLDALGIWTNQPGWAPFVVGAIALAGVWALAASNIRGGTRVLLVIEGTTVALILIVSVDILIRLATGTAPNGNTLDFSVFSVPGGIGTSALFLGVVFGFLSCLPLPDRRRCMVPEHRDTMGHSWNPAYVRPLRRDAAGRREADGRRGPRRRDRLPDGERQVNTLPAAACQQVSTLRLRLRLSAFQLFGSLLSML